MVVESLLISDSASFTESNIQYAPKPKPPPKGSLLCQRIRFQ